MEGTDTLMWPNGEAQTIRKLYHIPMEQWYICGVNGDASFFTTTHPFMTLDWRKSVNPEWTMQESPWLMVTAMMVWDYLVKDNWFERITSIDCEMTGDIMVYDFWLNDTKSFYANGYLTHNVDRKAIQHVLGEPAYAIAQVKNPITTCDCTNPLNSQNDSLTVNFPSDSSETNNCNNCYNAWDKLYLNRNWSTCLETQTHTYTATCNADGTRTYPNWKQSWTTTCMLPIYPSCVWWSSTPPSSCNAWSVQWYSSKMYFYPTIAGWSSGIGCYDQDNPGSACTWTSWNGIKCPVDCSSSGVASSNSALDTSGCTCWINGNLWVCTIAN